MSVAFFLALSSALALARAALDIFFLRFFDGLGRTGLKAPVSIAAWRPREEVRSLEACSRALMAAPICSKPAMTFASRRPLWQAPRDGCLGAQGGAG